MTSRIASSAANPLPPKTRPHVLIRWMISRDLPEVLEIEQLSFCDDPWTQEDFYSWLRERNVIAIVAEYNSVIVGYVVYGLYGDRIEILNLAVHPSCHGQGVGSTLIEKMIDKLSMQQRTHIAAAVSEVNVAAQLFFRAMGFRCVDIEAGYYTHADADAYWFEFWK